MTEQQRQLRQWVSAWQTAGSVMEQLRAEDIRQSNTASAIEMLNDVFESARLHCPPCPTSGLIEQQRLFARSRP